jgi:purine-cytosine permease-like protein
MKIFKCLNDKYEMIIVFLNILFFMCIQILFFKYFISKEYDHILKNKFNIVKTYILKDEDLKIKYNNYKNYYIKNYKNISEKQFEEREKINLKLIYDYCIKPVIGVMIIIFILYLLPLKSEWDNTYYLAILLIVTIYIPEIILYILVFSKYQYIGNIDIITKIYLSLIT